MLECVDSENIHTHPMEQTSQPQNNENLETEVKKIWRLIDRQTKPSKHMLINRKCLFPAYKLPKTCVDMTKMR